NALSMTRTVATHGAIAKADAQYQPKIDADKAKIASITVHEQTLKNKVEHFRFLSSCEADTPICSTTGKMGCSTYCQHYARLAVELQAELNSIKPQDARTIRSLRADI